MRWPRAPRAAMASIVVAISAGSAEKVADQNGLGTQRQTHARGQFLRHVAGGAFLRQQNFGQSLDDVTNREGGREAKQTGAFAAPHEHIGGGEAKHEGPVDFRLQRELRGKPHGSRAVDPNVNGMRGFPFALAHIKAFVILGRAAPIDAVCRLARGEGAKLPEGFACARAPAAMHAMHDARRNFFRTCTKARKALRQFERMVLVRTPGTAFISFRGAGR